MRGFRIVLAAHGDLAAALAASAEMICGPIEDAVALGLQPDHSPETFASLLREAVGDGPCLILTDLRGGTPCNVAMLVARGRRDVVALAGVNLGMVIEAATSLESLGEDAIEQLIRAGRDSIVNASARLVRIGT